MKQRETILASGVSSETPIHTQATARPWIACFSTLDRVHVGFHIAGKPYGSTRPICEARLSDQYAPEMAANAALIVKAVNSHEALVRIAEIFLNGDERFKVAIGGNPIALDKMLAEARAALAGAK